MTEGSSHDSMVAEEEEMKGSKWQEPRFSHIKKTP